MDTKLNAFLSVILSLFAVLSISAFIVLLVLRTTSLLPGIIRSTDFLDMLFLSEDGEHAYYITDQINALPFNDTEVTLHEIDDFIKKDVVSGEISVIADGYIRALGRGNLDHHVTTDDVVAAVRNIEPELNEFFNHQLTEEDFEHMAHTLDDIMDFDSLTLGGLMEDFEIDPEIIRLPAFIMSPTPLWITGIVSALLLFAIVFLNKRNIANAVLIAGIPVAVAGLLTFAGSMYFSASPEAFGETVHHYVELYSRYIDGPVHSISQYGFAFAAAGVLIIVVSLMIRRVAQINHASRMARR